MTYKNSFVLFLVLCLSGMVLAQAQFAQARPQAAIPGTWKVETVDKAPVDSTDPENLGLVRYPSLAIDSAGLPQVAYSNGLDENATNPLFYARKSGTSWITQTLEASGEKPSLALSSQQQPRLAFFDFETNETLIFRNLDIAGGFRQVVTTTIGSTRATADLALDSNDKAHIAFTQLTSGNIFTLVLATQDISNSWTIEPVLGNVGSIASLALDSANRVHLSYQDIASRTVNYATRTQTGWLTETVGSLDTLSLATHNKIAIDAGGTLHIAYVSFVQQALIYAKRLNNGWVTETIASANEDFSFVLDKAGNPHIAYIEMQTGHPIYAVRANNTWMTSTASSDAARFISLALDPGGQPGISYTDIGSGDLKFTQLGLPFTPTPTRTPTSTSTRTPTQTPTPTPALSRFVFLPFVRKP